MTRDEETNKIFDELTESEMFSKFKMSPMKRMMFANKLYLVRKMEVVINNKKNLT